MIKFKDIKIIYEDENFLVIEKPAGLVVHEGAGQIGETLADYIRQEYPKMANYTWLDPVRAGIVHRLDKDTSGIIIVAKNPETQKFFQDQFKAKTVEKSYSALVLGKVEPKEGEINIHIERHPKHPRKMSVSYLGQGKSAITKYKTIANYSLGNNFLTLLEVMPETGRMHQIRVHLKHKGYPVIGDQTYNTKESAKISQTLGANRQFLHAFKIKIRIPSGETKEFRSNLPHDLQKTLTDIEKGVEK